MVAAKPRVTKNEAALEKAKQELERARMNLARVEQEQEEARQKMAKAEKELEEAKKDMKDSILELKETKGRRDVMEGKLGSLSKSDPDFERSRGVGILLWAMLIGWERRCLT